MVFGEGPCTSLRDGVDALLMSGVWRPAALALVRGARERWSPADLARWLVGPYRDATALVPRVGVEPAPVRRLVPAQIQAIHRRAARVVVAALRDGQEDAVPTFVAAAICDRCVVPTLDGIWVPLDRPRMRLEDRVLSLFAADYLLRAKDYQRALVVCTDCDAVVFDPVARATVRCGAHRIRSVVVQLRLTA
jgi:hypothetical protein